MVFVVCQLQDECQEQNVRLHTTFMDLTKAFNTVCWFIHCPFLLYTKIENNKYLFMQYCGHGYCSWLTM